MPDDRTSRKQGLDRRAFVAGGLAAAAAACTSGGRRSSGTPSDTSASTAGTTAAPPATTSSAPGSAAGGPAAFVVNANRARPEVALTFHVSGDPGLVDALLAALATHQTPITAFMVGSWLEANPGFAQRFVSAGHELANHTYTHPTFASLSPDAMATEVTRCRDVLHGLAGTPGDWFRTSGTANGVDPPPAAALRAAADAGYSTVIGYDVDPADYADPGATAIVQRVAAGVKPGSIVSLHFGHQGTIDALPGILSTLSSRQLTPVVLRTLLAA